MRLIFLGAPGAGKGTMASAVSAAEGIAHISTGDLFRKHLTDKTELGILAEGYMSAGKLVPDDVTVGMVRVRLQEEDAKAGFIFDGFPRTLAQAEALDAMLAELDLKLDAVIDLAVPETELFRRITTRRVCRQCGQIYNVETMPSKVAGICDLCGGELMQRADDNAETLRARLDVYYDQTEPLIEYYRKQGLLQSFDNMNKEGSDVDQIVDLVQKSKRV
ncbi:MAG TPA: adenylate kinase [Clostridiaceae bacterium]|nr:adenylate kinase [Clostridiaceae bacterium]